MLTAGENSPRAPVVDHFPVSRASRWKQNHNPGGAGYDGMQHDGEFGFDPTAGSARINPFKDHEPRPVPGAFQN